MKAKRIKKQFTQVKKFTTLYELNDFLEEIGTRCIKVKTDLIAQEGPAVRYYVHYLIVEWETIEVSPDDIQPDPNFPMLSSDYGEA